MIKGFRVKGIHDNANEIAHISEFGTPKMHNYVTGNSTTIAPEKIEIHTGTFDRNQMPIYEGDWLRSKSCTEPFRVNDIVSFLMMCGEYRARNGVDIFDSLEVVGAPNDGGCA